MPPLRRGARKPTDGATKGARAAGLRYGSDQEPGIRRVRAGRGFRYLHPDGRPVADEPTLARIRALAIPPAYRDVWIAPDPKGHIQATGRDARGRKQYRYHPQWRAVRDATKFDRMLAFSRALPAIRRQIARDLARRGLSRAKVLAAVVRLLHETRIRIGNEEYVRANRSYGLTTLRDHHVAIRADRVVFEFRGKRGKQHRCALRDRRLARVIAHCQAIPGERLFQYVDASGRRQAVDSGDLNAYLRAAGGGEFSAKDFRTWSGSLLALRELLAARPGRSERERRRTALAVIDRVAEQLYNTRAICQKYYVHPAILEAYADGTLAARTGADRPGKGGPARLLVRFLRRLSLRRTVRPSRRLRRAARRATIRETPRPFAQQRTR